MPLSRRAALLALLATPTPVFSQSQTPSESDDITGLIGQYSVLGRGATGQAYEGDLEITAAGSGLALRWDIGDDIFTGTGTLDGRVLTVDWSQTDPVIYVVMPDGELHGTWDDGLATEKAIPKL